MDVQAPLAETIELISKASNVERSAVVTLGPLEGITILFLVCTITGLVITSPWVFYQVWAFVAAGLYRHERHYVLKFLPVSLGLFLAGVFLCFFCVLPVTLGFLLQINVWLKIEPSLRLSEWMGFATILPLVFGICFQTPLVMLFLERVGILQAEDFRKKRKYAILIMVVVAARRHARARRLQPVHARRADDRPLRAGHPAYGPRQAQGQAARHDVTPFSPDPARHERRPRHRLPGRRGSWRPRPADASRA